MNPVTPSSIERCWNFIGIEGDRSCPQLATYTHCRNCPVYSTAGHQCSIELIHRHMATVDKCQLVGRLVAMPFGGLLRTST